MDKLYTMVNGDINKKRFFSGNFGWKIHWESSLKMWKLGNVKTPDTYALHSQSSTYPLGKAYWKVTSIHLILHNEMVTSANTILHI